jgi:hypothetical protein
MTKTTAGKSQYLLIVIISAREFPYEYCWWFCFRLSPPSQPCSSRFLRLPSREPGNEGNVQIFVFRCSPKKMPIIEAPGLTRYGTWPFAYLIMAHTNWEGFRGFPFLHGMAGPLSNQLRGFPGCARSSEEASKLRRSSVQVLGGFASLTEMHTVYC